MLAEVLWDPSWPFVDLEAQAAAVLVLPARLCPMNREVRRIEGLACT